MNPLLTISYKPTFVRQYSKLVPELQAEVKRAIALFAKNPRHPSLRVHKLKGKLKQFFSFSVNYQYRIVFMYESKKNATLLAVGDHDVYR